MADDSILYGILEENVISVLAGDPFLSLATTDETYSLSAVKLLAPCLPSKMVALGLNYHSHAEEFDRTPPSEPLIFLKPSTAIIGPEDEIVYPPSSSRVDYEGELGVVIGKTAWQVPAAESYDYILGYTCVNDVTARDLQAKDKQWTRGKSFDTFAPIGPWIETDLDNSSLKLETLLNGRVKQNASTTDLVFPVAKLIEFVSEVMTLLPGDIIATGTPSGIGPMYPGDTVEVRIQGIGTLRNHVTEPHD